MKKMMFAALVLSVGMAVSAAYAPSALPSGVTSPEMMPGQINYQGVLRDPKTGDLYKDGIYTLDCRIYTAASGGTILWGGSYQAYVKNGYFNLMLGSSTAELSSSRGTFGPTDLWKALWYTGSNRELYLGVTPWQDSACQAIASDKRREISPRQQLLATPFAMRAQKAQYADAAPGDFDVKGKLSVHGDLAIDSGKKLTLKNITASDSEVRLGNSKTSPATTTLQGGTVNVEAGTAMNVISHGNATVTMDSGKNLSVKGGNLKADTVGVDLKASSDAAITAGGILSLTGGSLVRGSGRLAWYDEWGNSRPPFLFRTFKVTVPKNQSGANPWVSGVSSHNTADENWVWMPVGYSMPYGQKGTLRKFRVTGGNTDMSVLQTVEIGFDSIDSTADRVVTVQLLGILKQFCQVPTRSVD